jgi:hypothetical protein
LIPKITASYRAVGLAVFLIYFFGCEGPVEQSQPGFNAAEAFVSSYSISPDTLNLIAGDDGSLNGLFTLRATIEQADQVQFPAYIILSDNLDTSVLATYEVPESQLNGKELIFNGELSLNELSSITANVQLQLLLKNGVEIRAERLLTARSGENSAPSILDVAYPDTARIPDSGQLLVPFVAQATDPEGLGDIPVVYMDIFTKGSTTQDGQLLLRDDGSAASGDQQANDGLYTAVIGLTPSSNPRTFELHWYVLDRQGLSSDTLITEFTTIRE